MIYWDFRLFGRNVWWFGLWNATNGVVTRAPISSFGLFSIASHFRILKPMRFLEFKAEKNTRRKTPGKMDYSNRKKTKKCLLNT